MSIEEVHQQAVNEELIADLLEQWDARKIPRSRDRAKTRIEDEFIVKQLTKDCPDLQPELRKKVHALRRMEWLDFPLN